MVTYEISRETGINDPTFRSYSFSQAALYASARLSYPPALYDALLSYHASTSGAFDTVLDVGCGTGNAVRDLARSFEVAIGVDPGEEMIKAARRLGGNTAVDDPIAYYVAGAEELDTVEQLGEKSVDLLIAAMAVRSHTWQRAR